MNMINGIARGGSSYALLSPTLAAEEQMNWGGAPENVARAKCTQMCTVGKRIQGLKGFLT